MNWNIPQASGQTLQISLGAGDRLFMLGANGSGKSALIQHLVSSNPRKTIRRISAHRQTWFDSGSIDFTPRNRKDFDRQYIKLETQADSRWKDHNAHAKQSAVFFDLIAKDNAEARSLRSLLRHGDPQDPDKTLKNAIEAARSSVPLFEQLNELLVLGTLPVSLENSEGEEILAHHGNGAASFSIAQMSDGERSAALIAATVLTVKPETVLLIDEPELHLHRSIIEPFLSALFEQRKDCTFIVSTHEIALPMAHPAARVLLVRSCQWSGNTAKTWDVKVLEPDADLPEDLRRAILGARRRIVFVEGESGSLDLPLYAALFPGLSVIPKGSCADVQKAVRGLRASQGFHHVEAFGLIDRDDRLKDEIGKLVDNGVFVMDACSVESLYYCSDAIAAVARWQAESLRDDANAMIESAEQEAFDALAQNEIPERMAARRCERQIRNSMMSQLPTWKRVKDNAPFTITVDSPYPDELNRLQELVAARELDGLVARYPLRESNVFNAIAIALKCQTRGDYERMVVSRILKDDDLAQQLKQRIGSLSIELEA